MIYWAPLLHFYQPPTQLHWVLQKVCNESYRPLVDLFRSLPHAEVTVNINAVLTEMLDEHCMMDVIYGLKDLAEQGRLEFTGSAKYHAILPLMSQEEMMRQIVLNHQANRSFFGDVYSPKGFFPPEMCFASNIVGPVLETGHRWVILSGVSCPAPWPTEVIYQTVGDGRRLAVVFRDDVLSNRVSFRQTDAASFISHLKGLGRKGESTYVVTAMDAETFGHHIQNWEKLFLAQVYQAVGNGSQPAPGLSVVSTAGNDIERSSHYGESADIAREHAELLRGVEAVETQDICVVTISKLLDLVKSGENVEPRASSWSTSGDDILAGNPYPLWKSKDNPIHQLQWQHLKIAIELTRKAKAAATGDPAKSYADIARNLLDRAMHSDQFWWASKRPWWDLNLVMRGMMQQREVVFNAYKAIKVSALPEEEKEDLYYRVAASTDLSNKVMDQLLLS